MANVRCPMCSKLNPPEAETCAYCGARIKMAGSSPVPPAGSSGSDEPEWLRQLREERSDASQENSSDEVQPAENGDSEPDWLSRIRDRARSETDEGSDDEPDWLKGLRADETPGQSQDDDWLRGLAPDLPSDLGAAEESSAGEEDWLSKLSDWTAGSEETPKEGGEPTPSGLSWLEEPVSGEPASAEEPSGFGLTGFLSELEQSPEPTEQPKDEAFDWAAPEEPSQPGEGSSGFGLTGFLSDLSGGESRPQEEDETGKGLPETPSEEGLPDWLSGAQSSSRLPGSQPEEGEEIDWLKDLEPHSTPTAPDDEIGLPDWLRGESAAEQPAASEQPDRLSGSETAAQPPAGQAEEPAADETVPDWLSIFAETPAEPQAVEQPAEPAEADLPVWLSEESASPAAESPESEEEVLPAAAPESLPDWFASFDQADLEPTQPNRVTDGLGSGETDEPQELPAETSGEVPDWLQAFQDEAQEETSPESAPAMLNNEEPESVAYAAEQPFTVDLPDWLDEDAASHPVEAGELPAEPAGEELAQADLPEWVKEMRPIDTMIPAEAQMTEMDQRVEKAGPLAGMRGVLPSEELVTRWRKLPVYSVKLRVTEKQRSQAALFESILNQEAQPLLIPRTRPQGQGLFLRALIALLFVIVLTVPFLPVLKVEPLGVPVLYPAEMLDMFETIDSSTQNQSPVLLAVDYQPALSREMSMASQAVIDHLMSKNARIVVVSTVPTGPALAQQLLEETAAAYAERAEAAYNLEEQTVNLGFLPGGTISLLEFAQHPQRAAPSTLSGGQAWSNTFLQDVSSLSEFSQVVVITDSGETGRAWVEQVQPWMGEVPLFMVTSAQAAPLMAPYVESSQVAGMVSGLLGGAMYARLLGQTAGSAFNYLAAYQVGIVFAMALVLVGGLISGTLALIKRNDKQED